MTTVCQLLLGLSMGGAEVLAARTARRLRERFRFVFACLDEPGTLGEELRAEGFAIHELGRRPGIDWRSRGAISRLVRADRVDVIHAHQYTPFFYAAFSRFPWRRPPILFTEHGRFFPDYPRPKRIAANRLLLRGGDQVIAVGEAVRGALLRNEGIAPDRVEVVYNGVDLDPYPADLPDPSELAAARREMGVGPDDFVIIQVARLDHLKDHSTAVKTVSHLRRSLPNARLVLVGEGPERRKIEAAIAFEGVGDHVRMLGLRRDVARLIFASDLFLLTSVSEGIPLTLIEAMAARLPVVATDVGGVAEVVQDKVTGWLAPSGDAEALAVRVLDLALDPDRRREAGRLGRLRAEEMFSEDRMIDRYERLYEQAAALR